MAVNQDPSQRDFSTRQIESAGFDSLYKIPATELVAEDGSNNVLRRVQVDSSGALKAVINTGDLEIGAVEIKDGTTDTRAVVSSKGLSVYDTVANSLAPATYDYISLSYTGSNLTGVVYKTGGSGGTTISTLTLAYDGSNNLTGVTKT